MKKTKYFLNPKKFILYLMNRGYLKFLPDKMYLKIKYFLVFGKKLNLKNPKSYNEKLQWLKLYDRKDIYTKMVDKITAKEIVSDIIGEEYIIPTIGIYEKFDDIDFNNLPNQFVIKCSHDSGGIIICKDKNEFDLKKSKKNINKALKRKYYYSHREWPYKNVKPRLIIEKYMIDKTDNELRDYKFFCFNGKVKLMFIASNRQGIGDTYFDFFDEKFNHLNFTNGHPCAKVVPHKPKNFELMIKLSEKLSRNIIHVRIDFYEINGKVYFGEMTFHHWSGMVPFEPEEWDYKIGELLDLNSRL